MPIISDLAYGKFMFTVEKSNSSESKSHSLGSALVKLAILTFVEMHLFSKVVGASFTRSNMQT